MNNYVFNGSDYEPDEDNTRLIKQHEKILEIMKDGKYRTLEEIKGLTGFPESSISAQLRHLRKPRFGAHTVNKQIVGDRKNGLWAYAVIVRKGLSPAASFKEQQLF